MFRYKTCHKLVNVLTSNVRTYGLDCGAVLFGRVLVTHSVIIVLVEIIGLTFLKGQLHGFSTQNCFFNEAGFLHD